MVVIFFYASIKDILRDRNIHTDTTTAVYLPDTSIRLSFPVTSTTGTA